MLISFGTIIFFLTSDECGVEPDMVFHSRTDRLRHLYARAGIEPRYYGDRVWDSVSRSEGVRWEERDESGVT